MDELELIRRRSERIAPVRQEALDAGRARLLDGMREPTARRRAPSLNAARGPAVRRLVVRTAVVGLAAAGVAAALVLPRDAGHRIAPVVPVSDAVALARRAETHARTEPAIALTPGQWAHVTTLQRGPHGDRGVRQTWTRMDGRRSQRGALPLAARGTVLIGLPDDPAAALGRLYAEVARVQATPDSHGRVRFYAAGILGVPRDQAVFSLVTTLLGSYDVPPRTQATLYGVLSRLPGAGVIKNETDAAGRHGVALYIKVADTQRNEVILDPATYHYLGSRSVADPGGTVYWSAQLSADLVSRPGEHK